MTEVKKRRKPVKWNIDLVRDLFEQNECKLISEVYINNQTDLTFMCKCGDESTTRLDRFIRSGMCKKCKKEEYDSSKRKTIEEVREIFLSDGCILITSEYFRNSQVLDFICSCGEKSKVSLLNFNRGTRCNDCANGKRSEFHRFPYAEVKEFFEKEGCKLLTDSYINNSDILNFICVCGEESSTSFANFKNGVRGFGCICRLKYTPEKLALIIEDMGFRYIGQEGLSTSDGIIVDFICSCGERDKKTLEKLLETKRCNFCSFDSFIEKISGENNYQWNPNKTDEDRLDSRRYPEYKIWRRQVFEKDNYTCQMCGDYAGGNLNAHHKDSFHWCEERRLDVSNGETLCESCHITGANAFHRIYGNRNNTEEQYSEWIERHRPLILNERRLT